MTSLRIRPRRHWLALGVAASMLAGCSGGSGDDGTNSGDDERTPEEILAQAKETLDATEGLRLRLYTEDLPDDLPGVLAAEGVGTRAPAFEGELTISLGGQTVDVPVVALEDEVYAQLPFSTGYVTVDPTTYGAPDPSDLLATDTGFSSLLTSTQSPQAGEAVRGGSDNSEVLTEYTGTVDGHPVTAIIPSASGTFDVVWQVSDSGELRQATLTGEFYPSTPSMTYTVDFSDYGTTQEITKP